MIHLKEFQVIADKEEFEGTQKIGVISLPIKQLKSIPNFGGEPDIIKSFQLMPGVQSGNEGTSNLYVRGGSPDQNFFLLDNIPLYYVNHIGGFVSTFDPNAINDIKLYKGGFPARYSGRLSSVIDMRMKDGNRNKTKSEIGIGVLTTRFYIEGPIKDSTWSYFLSLRRLNFDLLTRPLARLDSDGKGSAGYTFYDINGKIVKHFKNGSKLSFTFYDGRDKVFVNASKRKPIGDNVAFRYKSIVKWGNIMANISYTKPIKEKMFSTFSIGTTNFRYTTDINSKYSNPGTSELVHQSRIKFNSGINDILLQGHFDYRINPKNTLRFGSISTLHIFTPGGITHISGESDNLSVNKIKINALESGVFCENELRISDKIKIDVGAAFNSFFIKDTSFLSLQPRLILSYEPKVNFKIQGSCSRMVQNMHYLTNSGVGLPSDLWIPVSKEYKPEKSNQYSLGAFYTLKTKVGKIELSVEGYFKDMKNLLDFKEGASLFQDFTLDNKIVGKGLGNVYGIEFLVRKTTGRLTGWIGYTLSKNTREFEELNNGKPFPYLCDRTHDVSVVVFYALNESIQLTSTWTYMSGAPITLAQGAYLQMDVHNLSQNSFYDFKDAHIYGGKNSVRLPAYHKMDIGAQFIKQKPKGERTWFVGVYNIYNRQNIFLLFYKKNNNAETKLYQLTLFPIIPSISYSFKF